jgi:hypothetical protein
MTLVTLLVIGHLMFGDVPLVQGLEQDILPEGAATTRGRAMKK